MHAKHSSGSAPVEEEQAVEHLMQVPEFSKYPGKHPEHVLEFRLVHLQPSEALRVILTTLCPNALSCSISAEYSVPLIRNRVDKYSKDMLLEI